MNLNQRPDQQHRKRRLSLFPITHRSSSGTDGTVATHRRRIRGGSELQMSSGVVGEQEHLHSDASSNTNPRARNLGRILPGIRSRPMIAASFNRQSQRLRTMLHLPISSSISGLRPRRSPLGRALPSEAPTELLDISSPIGTDPVVALGRVIKIRELAVLHQIQSRFQVLEAVRGDLLHQQEEMVGTLRTALPKVLHVQLTDLIVLYHSTLVGLLAIGLFLLPIIQILAADLFFIGIAAYRFLDI